MDINTDDTPELLSSTVAVQDKITEDHTYRPGTVLAWISVFVSSVKHYKRGKTQDKKGNRREIFVQVVIQNQKNVWAYQIRIT